MASFDLSWSFRLVLTSDTKTTWLLKPPEACCFLFTSKSLRDLAVSSAPDKLLLASATLASVCLNEFTALKSNALFRARLNGEVGTGQG